MLYIDIIKNSIAINKYKCECGMDVSTKNKEIHEANDLNHLLYMRDDIKKRLLDEYREIIEYEDEYLEKYCMNVELDYTDSKRGDYVDYDEFLKIQENVPIPENMNIVDEEDLKFLYDYRDELEYYENRIKDITK